jgi:hypothetical protein
VKAKRITRRNRAARAPARQSRNTPPADDLPVIVAPQGTDAILRLQAIREALHDATARTVKGRNR